MSPLHILKTTYLSHGYTWGIVNKPLISDRVEAWKHGPVIPVVYEALSQYGSRVVDALHYCGTPLSSTGRIKERVEELSEQFHPEEKDVIDCVVDEYKNWTGGQLIALMHKKGTPWRKYYVKGETDIVIPDDETREYYRGLVNERQRRQ